MYHDVIDIRCLDDFRLELRFDDAKPGALDSRAIIAKGGIVARLRNPELFRRAKVNVELGPGASESKESSEEADVADENA